MTQGVPEEWTRSFIDGQDPRITPWLDRCWTCPAPGNMASDLQLNWKRLSPDAFLRALRFVERDLGTLLPAECEPDWCAVFVTALDTEE